MKNPRSGSEEKYRALFGNMSNAFALHEIIFDLTGKPVDYRFVDVNPAFEKLTGLKAESIINKTVKEVLPNTEGYWIERYGEVVKTGKQAAFRNYSSELDKHYDVVAYKTNKNQFAVIFSDITERVKSEMEKEISIQLLRLINSPNDLHQLMKYSVGLFKEFTGCEAVGIRLREGEDFPYFETEGFPEDFVRKENTLCSRDNEGNILRRQNGEPILECMCGNILLGRFNPQLPFFTEHGSFWSSGTSELLTSTTEEDRQAHTRNYCNIRGYESVAIVPLKAGGETFGLLQFNDHRKGMHTKGKIEFLEHLADYFALGLAKKKSDEMLSESEEKFRKLFELMQQGVFYQQADGRLSDINEAALEMFGLTRKEFLNRTSLNPEWKVTDSKGVLLMPEEHPSMVAIISGKPVIGKEVGVFNSISNSYRWFIANAQPEFRIGENSPYRVAVTLHEITERKLAEEALKRDEEVLRLFVEHSPVAISMFDKEMKYIVVSRRYRADFDLGEQDLIGCSYYNVFPGISERWKEIYDRCLAGSIEKLDEDPFYSFDGKLNYVRWEIRPWYEEEGIIGGVISFSDVITEYKQAIDALRESEARLADIIFSMADWVWEIDANGVYTYSSQKGYDLFGERKEDIIGKTPFDFMLPDEAKRLAEILAKIIHDKKPIIDLENWNIGKDGKVICLLTNGVPILDQWGNLAGYRGVDKDITEQKYAQAALRESNERFRKVYEEGSLGMAMANLSGDGRFISVNKALCEMLGYTEEELMQFTFGSITHPDYRLQDIETVRKMREGQIQKHNTEKKYLKKNGEVIWAIRALTRICSADGKSFYALAMIADITERKLAEETLRTNEEVLRVSEEKYRSIFDNSPMAVEFYDSKGYYIDGNKAALDLFGIEKIESMQDFNFFNSSQVNSEIIEKCQHGIPVRYEKWVDFENIAKDKIYATKRSDRLYLDINATPIMVKGIKEPKAYVVQIQDITERKETEDFFTNLYNLAIKLSQTFDLQKVLNLLLTSAIEVSGMNTGGIYIIDSKSKALNLAVQKGWSDSFIEEVKYFAPDTKMSELIMNGKNIYSKYDELPNEGNPEFEDLKAIAIIPILHQDKVIACISLISNMYDEIVKIKRKRVELIATQLRGFIARALMHDELSKNEELLSNAAKIANLGHWEYDVETDTFTFNDLFYSVYHTTVAAEGGYTMPSSEYAGRFVHPEDSNLVSQEVSQAIQTDDPHFARQLEHRFIYADGGIGYLAVRYYIQKDANGKTIKIFGANQDITVRKRAEEELRLLNSRFITMINVSPLAIIMLDQNDRVQMWNNAAEKLFGYTVEESLGKLNPIFDEDFKDEYDQLNIRIRSGNQIVNQETYRRHKDGTKIPIYISSAHILDPMGEYAGRMAIIADITEKKRNERIMTARYNLVSSAQLYTVEELLAATLDEIETLTKSKIGFYHFVNEDQKSLVLQNWSTNTAKNMYSAEGKGGQYDIDKAGGWVDCLHSGKPVIHNDYALLPNKKGMPEGYAQVIREAVVPIFRGNKIVAIIGVGNKEKDYDENDIDLIWQLGDLSWDIVDKKKTEEEVLAQKNLLASIFESSPYIIALVDKDGNVSAINKQGETFTGKDKENIIDQLSGDVFNCINSFSRGGCGKTPNCSSCLIRNTINNTALTLKPNLNNEGRMTFVINGMVQEFDLLVSATPVKQKNIDYVLLTLVDITSRKKAEEAVLKSEKRLRKAQSIAGVGNWELDLKTKMMWASEEALNIYGIDTGNSEHPLEKAQKTVLPQYRGNLDDALHNLIMYGSDYNQEFRIKRPSDGEIRFIHSVAELHINPAGEKTTVQGVIQDITEQMNIIAELKESEERYRQLVELSPDAILIHQKGEIVYVNSSALKLFGALTKNQIIDTRLIDRVHSDYKNIVNKRIKSISMEGAAVPVIEEKIIRLDGTTVDVEVVASHFIYKGEQAVQVIARDITERRIFIDSLRLSEERFRNISNTISDIAYSCVQTGEGIYKLSWITGAAQNVTGFTNDEILEKQCWSFLVIKEDIDIFNKNVIGLLPGQTAQTEIRIRKKDGQLAWVMSFAECSDNKFKPGEHILYGGLVNITERKLFEVALQESEERFRTLIENAPDGIEVLDLEGNYLEVNSAACRQLGYTREELANVKLFEIDSGLDIEGYSKSIEQLRNGMRDHQEVIHRHKSGTLFPVEITSALIKIAGRENMLTIVRDITDRKKAERDLDLYRNHLEELVNERTNEIALINEKLINEIEKEKEIEIILRDSLDKEKELNELKSRFISTASHEFKTPLTAIYSSVELIQRYRKTWDDSKLDRHINSIQLSVEHLSKLIDEVLTISRSESGKIQCNPENLDLKELCNKFIDEVKPKMLKTHEFSFIFNSKQSEFPIDPKLMRYIIINLLTNAIKYSPAGGRVEFNVNISEEYIYLSVRDEGIGFHPEDEKHLFEPFFRANNALDFEGTGLGLSIVKRTVEVLKGSIDFKSQLGKGTIVEIKIPRLYYEKNNSGY